jgi:glucosamine--fructose-6-phosphate aminotransferase (isomerizing)
VSGEQTRAAVFAQPEWLRQVPTDARLPPARSVLYTGCGTSFHAAQTGGNAVQALDLVDDGIGDHDVLVLVSHEGETQLTLEAADAAPDVEKWAVTAAPDGPLARACDRVVVAAPQIEQSWCHTASYTCAVATLAAMRGEDVSWLPGEVEWALQRPDAVSDHERWLVVGAGGDWPTVQEAALKLREGAFVAAEAHHTEQLLHGHLSAIDEFVRAFVLDDGEGRRTERSAAAADALRELGCDVTVVRTIHPVVDIVRFHLLVLGIAERRGVDPDRIRRDDDRWSRAADATRR